MAMLLENLHFLASFPGKCIPLSREVVTHGSPEAALNMTLVVGDLATPMGRFFWASSKEAASKAWAACSRVSSKNMFHFFSGVQVSP